MRIDQIELSGRHQRPAPPGVWVIMGVHLATVAFAVAPAMALWFAARIDPIRTTLILGGVVEIAAACERPKVLFQVAYIYFQTREPWQSMEITPRTAKWILVAVGAALILAGTFLHIVPAAR